MKKVLFFGDSITDMNKYREYGSPYNLGTGHVLLIASELQNISSDYEVINQGIGGNKITDLYERLYKDVIEEKPDVLTILIGVNDVWHKIIDGNGTDLKTFTKLYQEIIDIVKKELPKCSIYLCEPFFLLGEATKEHYEEFKEIFKYAKKVKQLAKNNNLTFISLQKDMDKLASKVGVEKVLYDGVHPNVLGARKIATKWLGAFKKNEIK